MAQNNLEQINHILSLIDLTSLNDSDTDSVITELCRTALMTKHPELNPVAAVCVYSQFVPLAKDLLSESSVKVATVCNFPHGGHDATATEREVEKCVLSGADEIDLVLPYSSLQAGDLLVCHDMVKHSREICGTQAQLKVIIESGILATESLIKTASEICIENGADFVKTSTGKVEVNATLDAAKYILETIKQADRSVGFKAAGGIKTSEQALEYMALNERLVGASYNQNTTFRFGASSLVGNLLSLSSGKTESNQGANY